MFRNYFIIAFRSLRKQKLYSFINLAGLSVGLSCFILILLFVQHELSYDRFHEKREQIYRLIQQRPQAIGSVYWSATSPAMAGALAKEFPEIIRATTVGSTYNPLLSFGDDHYPEEGILADANFLKIFSFPVVQGNPQTALSDPNSIVLTKSLAAKIFGDQDPIGQTLLYQNNEAHVVTAIVEDVPATSHINFNYILPAQSDFFYRNGQDKPVWYNNGWYTYVLLTEGADVQGLQDKLQRLIESALSDWRPEDRMNYIFQPLADIHLHSSHISTFEFEKSGNIRYLYLFSAVGLIVLLLACVNYTSLAVARSIKRIREVGLRKTIGATRGQLTSQFLGESILMAFLSLIIALVIAPFFLPFVEQLLERPLQISYLDNPLLLPGLILLVLLVGLLSGSYPAIFMASLRPIKSLTGNQNMKTGRSGKFMLQRSLMVGQYVIALVLVIGSIIVHEQMQFVQNQELGYNREQVLVVYANDTTLSHQFGLIQETWLRNAHVEAVSYSEALPTNIKKTQSILRWEGSSEGERLSTETSSVDYDFLVVYGLEIVAGRGFSQDFGSDTLGAPIAVINEAAVRALGWTAEEAIGKQFDYTDGRGERTIIGVVKDFHFNSIHRQLGPLVLTLDRNPTGYISAKVRAEDLPGTIAMFQKTVEQFSPYPFEYQFLDESYDQLYKQEARLGKMFEIFTFLTFLIASLGLFGQAAFTAEQRTKEIGIRKVLGASVQSLVSLLARNFLAMVALSFLLAAPIAWYAAHLWLEDFVYRIEIQWWMFALAGVLALLIALLTVSYQSIRAATSNPVESLRSE